MLITYYNVLITISWCVMWKLSALILEQSASMFCYKNYKISNFLFIYLIIYISVFILEIKNMWVWETQAWSNYLKKQNVSEIQCIYLFNYHWKNENFLIIIRLQHQQFLIWLFTYQFFFLKSKISERLKNSSLTHKV